MAIPEASIYLSRHELVKEEVEEPYIEDKEEEATMANDTTSHTSTGSQYLQEVLGDVLADALSKVAKERPHDPIQYVADYLHGLKMEKKIMASSEDPEPSNDVNKEEEEDVYTDSGHMSRLDEYKETPDSANERRTAQSEPPPSIGGTISNPGTSSSSTTSATIAELPPKRTTSLDRRNFAKKKSRKGRKSTSFSKHLPAAAMSSKDYRARRGLLPPMKESPKSSASKPLDSSYQDKQKFRQLAPIYGGFDMEKHQKRNRKITERMGRVSIR